MLFCNDNCMSNIHNFTYQHSYRQGHKYMGNSRIYERGSWNKGKPILDIIKPGNLLYKIAYE